MPRSDEDAVTALPLRLIRIPILAEVIGFILQRPFASRLFPRDVASAVTMSALYMLCGSSIALSVGKISHVPVPASLSRDRVLFLFSLLAWFPVRLLDQL